MQGPCWQISVPLTAAWKKHTLSTLITDGVYVHNRSQRISLSPQSVQDREAILERFLEGETSAVNEKNHNDAICYMFIPGLLWLNSAWGVEDWVKGGSVHLISFPPVVLVVLIAPLFSRHVPAGRPRDLSLVRLSKMPFSLTGFDCDPWIWRHLLCATTIFFYLSD